MHPWIVLDRFDGYIDTTGSIEGSVPMLKSLFKSAERNVKNETGHFFLTSFAVTMFENEVEHLVDF